MEVSFDRIEQFDLKVDCLASEEITFSCYFSDFKPEIEGQGPTVKDAYFDLCDKTGLLHSTTGAPNLEEQVAQELENGDWEPSDQEGDVPEKTPSLKMTPGSWNKAASKRVPTSEVPVISQTSCYGRHGTNKQPDKGLALEILSKFLDDNLSTLAVKLPGPEDLYQLSRSPDTLIKVLTGMDAFIKEHFGKWVEKQKGHVKGNPTYANSFFSLPEETKVEEKKPEKQPV